MRSVVAPAYWRSESRGAIRPSTISRMGSVTNKWMVNPAPIVNAYRASGLNASKPGRCYVIFVIRANTPIGRNLMMPEVSRIIAWKSASKRFVTIVTRLGRAAW